MSELRISKNRLAVGAIIALALLVLVTVLYNALCCCTPQGHYYPCPTFVAIGVGLVVLAVSFALVNWAQKED